MASRRSVETITTEDIRTGLPLRGLFSNRVGEVTVDWLEDGSTVKSVLAVKADGVVYRRVGHVHVSPAEYLTKGRIMSSFAAGSDPTRIDYDARVIEVNPDSTGLYSQIGRVDPNSLVDRKVRG